MSLQASDNASLYLLLLDEGLNKLDELVADGEQVDSADCYLMAQELVGRVADVSTFLLTTLRIRLLNVFLLEYGLTTDDLLMPQPG